MNWHNLIWILVSILPLAIWIATISDIMSWPKHQWDAVGRSRTAWVLAVLFFQFIGTIAYWMTARPELESGIARDPQRDARRLALIVVVPMALVVILWTINITIRS